MRKVTMFMLAFVLTASFSFGQNLILNPDFEVGAPGDAVPSWSGFKNRIANDNITSSKVGQIQNGDGSLFQEFAVTPGETYNVDVEYRWLGSSGASNTNLTMRIKEVGNLSNNLDLIGANNGSNGYTLDTDLDVWKTASFSFNVPAGITNVRLLMFKGGGNKTLNVDNVVVEENTLSTQDFETFQFETYPNPVNDVLNISANIKIDKVELYDLLGNQVKSQNLNAENNKISVSELLSGIYILKTYIQDNVGTQKIIKK